MKRVAAGFRRGRDELAKLMTAEVGKTITASEAEIDKCAAACDFFAENAEKFLSPQTIESDASRSYVRFDPLGPVLAIMPWNFPMWQVIRFAAPGLMAGNVGDPETCAQCAGLCPGHRTDIRRCGISARRVRCAADLRQPGGPAAGRSSDHSRRDPDRQRSRRRGGGGGGGGAAEKNRHGIRRVRRFYRTGRCGCSIGRRQGGGGALHQQRAKLHCRQAVYRRVADRRSIRKSDGRGHGGDESGRSDGPLDAGRPAGAARSAGASAPAGSPKHRAGGQAETGWPAPSGQGVLL